MEEIIGKHWLYCPVCKRKTRTMLVEHTILKNFPLLCPKCKREMLIDVKDGKITQIKEPNVVT